MQLINSTAFRRKFVSRELNLNVPKSMDGFLNNVKFIDTSKELKMYWDFAAKTFSENVVSFKELRNYKLNLFFKIMFNADGYLPVSKDAVVVVNAISYAAFLTSGDLGTRPIDKLSSQQAYTVKDGTSKLVGHLSCFTTANSQTIQELNQKCELVNSMCREGGHLIDSSFISACDSLVTYFEGVFGTIKAGAIMTALAVSCAKLAHSGKLLNSIMTNKSVYEIFNDFYTTENLDEEYLDFSNFDKIKEFIETDYKVKIATTLKSGIELKLDDVFVPIATKGGKGGKSIVQGFWTMDTAALSTIFEKDLTFFNDTLVKTEDTNIHVNARWTELPDALRNLYALSRLEKITLTDEEKLLCDVYLRTVSMDAAATEAKFNTSFQKTFGPDVNVDTLLKSLRERLGDVISSAAKAVDARYKRVALDDVMSGCCMMYNTRELREDIFCVERFKRPNHTARVLGSTSVGNLFARLEAKAITPLERLYRTGYHAVENQNWDDAAMEAGVKNIDATTGCAFVGEFDDIKERCVRLCYQLGETCDTEKGFYGLSTDATATIINWFTVLPPGKGEPVASFKGTSGNRRQNGSREFRVVPCDPRSCSTPDLLMSSSWVDLNNAQSNYEGWYKNRLENLVRGYAVEDAKEVAAPVNRDTKLSPLSSVVKQSGAHFMARYADALVLPDSCSAGASKIKGSALPAGRVVKSSYVLEIKNIDRTYLDPAIARSLDNSQAPIERGAYKGQMVNKLVMEKDGTYSYTTSIFTDADSPNFYSMKGFSLKDRADGKRIMKVAYPHLGIDISEDGPLYNIELDGEVKKWSDVTMSCALRTAYNSSQDMDHLMFKYVDEVAYAAWYNLASKSKGEIATKVSIVADKKDLIEFDGKMAQAVFGYASKYFKRHFGSGVTLVTIGGVTNESMKTFVDALDACAQKLDSGTTTNLLKVINPIKCMIGSARGLLLPVPFNEKTEMVSDKLKLELLNEGGAFFDKESLTSNIFCARGSGFFTVDTAEQIDSFLLAHIEFILNDDNKQ